MNDLQVFRHTEFGELRVMTIDGKEFFPATACAKVLGYEKPHDAVSRHCRYSVKHGVPHPQNSTKTVEMNFIPEGDLYRLIVHSRLPAAERFERWVFDEVLPAIRRTGAYAPDAQAAIAQMIQSAVVQTIHALAPYLAGVDTTIKKRVRRRVTSLAEQLETPLRMELEEMIMDPSFGYVAISEYFRDRYGVLISKSSIGRYAQRLYEAVEAEGHNPFEHPTQNTLQSDMPHHVYVDAGNDELMTSREFETEQSAYIRNGYEAFKKLMGRPPR